MRNILSIHDAKMLSLLEELNRSRQPTSLESLHKKLSMPTRTIYNYIQEFNDYNLPVLVKSGKQGVNLYIPRDSSFRCVYKAIYENSLELTLFQQLFLTENLSLKTVADNNFTSLSTVKRAFSKIKKILAYEGIVISTSRKTIGGDEENVRQLLHFFYAEKYANLEFLSEEQQACLHHLIQSLFQEQGKKLYINQINRYMRWLYINLTRIKYHHFVELTDRKFTYCNLLTDISYLKQFKFLFNIDLTLDVINDVFYQLNNNYYFYSYQQMMMILSHSIDEMNKFNKIKGILQNISFELETPLKKSTKEMLILDFINILKFKNTRTFVLYDRRERFVSNLSAKYPHIIDYLTPYLAQLPDKPLPDIEMNELIYILITHWYELYNHLPKIESRITIYILVDTDIEHALFIKKDLEKYCLYNIECRLLMDDNIPTIDDNAILVTTMTNATHVAKNIICFSEFFSNRNWEDLNQLIGSLLSVK